MELFDGMKFIDNHIMNSKAYKKDKKSSKSAEKKISLYKNSMNIQIFKNSQIPERKASKAKESHA